MDHLQKLRIKNIARDYTIMTLMLLLSAVCYNVLLLPLDIVSGGTGGVGTIIKAALNIEPYITILVLSIICLLASWIFLGKEKTLSTAYASLSFPILVKLTAFIEQEVYFSTNDMFVIVIFAGILNGIANGIVYKIGYNSGGFSAFSQILFEKIHMPVAKSSFIINGTIVLVASYYFGLTKAMYAVLFLYINNLIMDKVLLGISKNKAFYIVTTKPDDISEFIINNLGHDTTNFDVKGGLLEKRKNVILTVIPSRDYYKVKEGIRMIDDKAFFVATDSYEVKGAS